MQSIEGETLKDITITEESEYTNCRFTGTVKVRYDTRFCECDFKAATIIAANHTYTRFNFCNIQACIIVGVVNLDGCELDETTIRKI